MNYDQSYVQALLLYYWDLLERALESDEEHCKKFVRIVINDIKNELDDISQNYNKSIHDEISGDSAN